MTLKFTSSSLPNYRVTFGSRKPQASGYSAQDTPRNSWQLNHPWYKNAWKHRFKLFAPLLASLPIQTYFIENKQSVHEVPQAELSNAQAPSVIESSSPAQTHALALSMILLALIMAVEPFTMLHNVITGFDRKRVAYHEIGHWLTGLRVLEFSGAEAISLGVIDGKVYPSNHTDREVQEIFKDKYAFMKWARQVLLLQKGGAAMEHLVSGYHHFGDIPGDKLASAILIGTGLVIHFAFIRDNKETKAFLRFINNRTRQTKDILMSFDRATVDALAEQLVQDKHWDKKKLDSLIKEYKLNTEKISV